MEKEIIKNNAFRIVRDSDIRGFGYSRIRHNYCYLHCIGLLGFMIVFITSRRHKKRQIAKFVTSNIVEIDKKQYPLVYFGSIEHLPHVHYINEVNTIIKTKEFQELKTGRYAIYDIVAGKWKIKENIDVYIFHPNNYIKGYIKGNEFIGIKELSVG